MRVHIPSIMLVHGLWYIESTSHSCTLTYISFHLYIVFHAMFDLFLQLTKFYTHAVYNILVVGVHTITIGNLAICHIILCSIVLSHKQCT